MLLSTTPRSLPSGPTTGTGGSLAIEIGMSSLQREVEGDRVRTVARVPVDVIADR